MISLKHILLESLPHATSTRGAARQWAPQIARELGETLGAGLGAGANGVAWRLGSGKVLKLTSSRHEAAAASRLRNRYRVPMHHVAIPWGVHPIDSFQFMWDRGYNSPDLQLESLRGWFALVLPYVDTLRHAERQAWDIIDMDFLDSGVTDEWLREKAERTFHPDNWRFFNRIMPQRDAIIRDFTRGGISSIEAHSGNVGFDSEGRFVHFDYLMTDPKEPRYFYADIRRVNAPVQQPATYTADGIDTPGDADM